jgi:hypothetical protein
MYRKVAAIYCLTICGAFGFHRTANSGPALNARALRAAVAPAHDVASSDWESCHDDLDRTRRASSDASDAADDVKSKQDDFEECKNDPQTYDLLGDHCHSLRSDYQSAVNDYQNKMDDLDSRLRDVQSSCGYEFTINRMSAMDASKQRLDGAKQRLCTSYKNFLPTLSPQNVFQLCKAQMGDDWCKSCLGIP